MLCVASFASGATGPAVADDAAISASQSFLRDLTRALHQLVPDAAGPAVADAAAVLLGFVPDSSWTSVSMTQHAVSTHKRDLITFG